LAAAELGYSAFRSLPPSARLPIWARVLYVAVPGYLAIVEPNTRKRAAWTIIGICGAVSWLFRDTLAVTIVSVLQMVAGVLFVRATVSRIPAPKRLLGLAAAGAAGAVRIGTLYWWAQTLERYAAVP
jgi:hypothetical protein